jgi:glycosyltransferase involved in cell wall biosynthesis
MNFGAVVSYVNLFAKALCNPRPAVVDVNALASLRLKLRKDAVVDFRTPLSYELKWLRHDFLSSIARIAENALRHVDLVTAVNERMARYCTELGVQKVQVIPNYPNKDFRCSIDADEWKIMNNLSPNNKVVLFSGGVRLREIYGLDLLLESWKIVESSNDYCSLVILGNDSTEYIENASHSLNLKRILLPGRVGKRDVANWINCSDVCVAPRTPGFSNAFYDDKDSNKISEYAALKKPVVATCYAPSEQYLLVSPNPVAFAEGIMKGLEGRVSPSKSHYWEENEPRLLQSLESYWFQ